MGPMKPTHYYNGVFVLKASRVTDSGCYYEMPNFTAITHEIGFWLGLCPRHRWQAYSALQTPYLWIFGKGMRWGVMEREGGWNGRKE